jgi:hypothetical protein
MFVVVVVFVGIGVVVAWHGVTTLWTASFFALDTTLQTLLSKRKHTVDEG